MDVVGPQRGEFGFWKYVEVSCLVDFRRLSNFQKRLVNDFRITDRSCVLDCG
jgi:hypothetical protein